ncbi:MAG: hypothetical protein WDA47_05240 [Bacilli bacterium]
MISVILWNRNTYTLGYSLLIRRGRELFYSTDLSEGRKRINSGNIGITQSIDPSPLELKLIVRRI